MKEKRTILFKVVWFRLLLLITDYQRRSIIKEFDSLLQNNYWTNKGKRPLAINTAS